MGRIPQGQNRRKPEPIEVAPAPNLYLVEFIVGREPNERISVILPATSQIDAFLKTLQLFPEHHGRARRNSIHCLKYAEIDWQSGRTVLVKDKGLSENPKFPSDEIRDLLDRLKREEEESDN